MLLELQNIVLRMVAKGDDLKQTMDRLCSEVEKIAPGIACSMLTVDPSGRLHPLSAPSLPADYSVVLENLSASPNAGSCGTAAFLGKPISVENIATDPLWKDCRDPALALGFRACWSSPIINGKGTVVGTFAFYYRECRGPNQFERDVVEATLPLCVIALERNERLLEHHRLAYTDVLTGLPNRMRFNNILKDNEGSDQPAWAVLLIDIDNLKVVNDTFGHGAGDDLIEAVAHRIAIAADTNMTFRLSGDEFAVLIESGAISQITAVAERILDAIKPPLKCGAHTIFPTATIGGAVAESAGIPPETARQNADFALYHAKETRRGQFLFYSPGLGTSITARLQAIRAVSMALDDNRIEPYYQPIVRLDTGEIVGVEALCRMHAESGEVVPAKHFHEATKDAHVAAELTRQMVSRVATDIRHWLDLGIPFQHVGVNVSAADFHVGNLDELFHRTFEAAGVPMKHLILEVTESVYLGQRDNLVANQIRALREKGLRVALDDFGTGFASLTHLLTVPVDIIKIDKSFVDRIAHDDAGLAIIEGILSIAARLGIKVVAEGIESADQVNTLQRVGCKLGQGYLFSRAIPRDLITKMLLDKVQRKNHPIELVNQSFAGEIH